MQNFFTNRSSPGDTNTPGGSDGTTWWMKYVTRAAGIVSGFVAIFLGVFACTFTLDPWMILGGIWQICAGFILIVIEAPFCCLFLDFVQSFYRMVEGRPVWQKATLYLCLSLPPIFITFPSISILFGSGLIFATAIVNGMLVIGKKATLTDMAASAQPVSSSSGNMKSGLVGNIQGQDVEARKGTFT